MRLLGDTLAVGAAGAPLSVEAGVVRAAGGWGRGEQARLLGTGERLPAASAAFVNGFRIHCLEWDAVHARAVVHALSVVTAALGAAIDRRGGNDPDEVLAAVAVGVDIASGLGIAAESGLRFFRPATAGVIGAALAVARLERVERFEDVLGLAYSQASGTMQAHVEGSIALPLQIASAARAAIASVDMVKAGLTGPHDVLEGPYGYFPLFEQGNLASYADGVGDSWLIEEVSTKPYPSGRASHAVLGTLDALLRGGEIGPDEVVAVEAQVPPLVHRLVARPAQHGMSAPYARLCLPWLAALMLRDGGIDPRRLLSDDPQLFVLAGQVRVTLDDNPDPNALEPQRLIVRTGSRTIERKVERTLGAADAPLSADQTGAKFELAKVLAGTVADARIFDNPLRYFTESR